MPESLAQFTKKRIQQLILCLLIFLISGCSRKKPVSDLITIVNIGASDRISVGKQLRVISSYSPKVIALDSFFFEDSLHVDTVLVSSLSQSRYVIGSAYLDDEIEYSLKWGTAKKSHEKFRFDEYGFSNITITDDSVIVPELPMQQYCLTATPHNIKSLCYAIAKNSFGIQERFETNEDRDILFDDDIFDQQFNTINYEDLISGNFSPDDLNGKIVIMSDDKDENTFYRDSDKMHKISGAEVQACFTQAILKRPY